MAGVAHLLGHQLDSQLDCRFGRRAHEKQLTDISVTSMFLSPPSPLSKIDKHVLRSGLKKQHLSYAFT